MDIREKILAVAYKQVNNMSAIVDSNDTFVKLPRVCKTLARKGKSCIIHKTKSRS